MYVSIIIAAIIMTILVSLLVILHALAGAFPAAGQTIATIQMILLISILILVHEAGHFFAAELFKIPVTKFGFGLPIGPTLWRKKFGNVEIMIHAFLFGGYVEFPDDDKDSGLPADSPDKIMNRPAYQRFCVLTAGVAANVLCAFVFVIITAFMWGQMPSGNYEITIKDIKAPAAESVWESGMEKEDKVVEVNGSKVTTPNILMTYAQLSKKNDGKISEILLEQRYNALKSINPAFTRDEIIPKDVIVKLPAIVPEDALKLDNDVLRGLARYKDERLTLSEAQKNLRDKIADKKILVSDGTITLNDVAYAISDNVSPLMITVERNGEKVQLKPIYPNTSGTIGIKMDIREIPIETKGVGSVLKNSTKYLWNQTKLLLYGLYQIFTGKIPLDELHGIIAITKVGGDVIHSSGIFSGLLLTAIISMDLAIMNFLPLPALDGGHVMFLILEKIRGRKFEEETLNKIATAFFLALIVLMILVSFNDIYALIMNKL